jgi:hypothetical protein
MENLLINSSQRISFYGDLSLTQDFLYKYFGLQSDGGQTRAGGRGGLNDTISVWSLVKP